MLLAFVINGPAPQDRELNAFLTTTVEHFFSGWVLEGFCTKLELEEVYE